LFVDAFWNNLTAPQMTVITYVTAIDPQVHQPAFPTAVVVAVSPSLIWAAANAATLLPFSCLY